MAIILKVSPEEEGLKLLNFLLRNLESEKAELYRWIRTGQLRINSKRATATTKVFEGDLVRLPPYAKQKNQQIIKNQENFSKFLVYPNAENQFIEKIYENEHLLVINKNAGLASQGGTGQEIDLTKILKFNYQHSNFVPAPVHRLDKQTSGLVLIGKSYKALKYLSDFMQFENSPTQNSSPHKEYLAWVSPINGNSPDNLAPNKSFYLLHYLFQAKQSHKMQALNLQEVLNSKQILLSSSEKKAIQENIKLLGEKSIKDFNQLKYYEQLPQKLYINDQVARIALSKITCVKKSEKNNSYLLKIGIFTGRKHQIRTQCAKLGFPLVGDYKYGGIRTDNFNLHAYALYLEPNELSTQSSFFCKPSWQGEFEVPDKLI